MLKSIRYKNKLSQKDLAKKIGITQSHLSKIENNKFSPHIKTLIDISEVLDECIIEIIIHYCCIPCESCKRKNCVLKQTTLNNKRIQVTIPKKIFNQLKFDAEYEGRSISNLVAKIIKDYYKECEES